MMRKKLEIKKLKLFKYLKENFTFCWISIELICYKRVKFEFVMLGYKKEEN